MHYFQVNAIENRIYQLNEMLDFIKELECQPNHQIFSQIERELKELQHELDSIEVFGESNLGDDPI
jgi:septation ring formation regulator EzrA